MVETMTVAASDGVEGLARAPGGASRTTGRRTSTTTVSKLRR
jgi:hypothetical protein